MPLDDVTLSSTADDGYSGCEMPCPSRAGHNSVADELEV